MYPTKEEILAKNPKINKKIIKATISWKKDLLKNWKKAENKEKIIMLRELLYTLIINLHIEAPYVKTGPIYAYEQKTKTIYLDINHPSIISTLHELGHHIYGSSELKACRWSIWLFKECFPNQYKNLEWNKHLLIKKNKS